MPECDVFNDALTSIMCWYTREQGHDHDEGFR